MAYAAVTSLMETLSLNFLESQPPFPLEDLEAQIRDDANQNLGLLQQVLEAEVDEASSKRLPIKACFPRLYGKQQLAWDHNIPLLTSRLREVAQLKQNILSLHQNLGSLQQSLEKSEIPYNDAGEMKDLEAKIRDASFKAEERIEMELTTIYLAKDKGDSLRIAACLIRLHEIFNEAEKQTDYHRNEMIRIQTEYQQLAKVSLLGRIRRRGLLQLVKGSSLPHDLVHKNIIVTKCFKNSSKFDSTMVGCHEVFKKILDQLTQQSTKRRHVVSIVGMGGIASRDDELHKQSIGQDQLAERLRKHLKEQRYLIVIDDIWSTTAWDSVQRCFPDDNNGSCILLTSRLREMAKYVSSGI
ncbi:putative disease resistance protein At1g50180 isoform X2 [Ipomoea triloba]|uniref:putative disease resistance protein At1g50180 isoform X2 n=1 Tax=Ipomoea triloba TaxID=35885 RepID=UPI00125E21DD|nr:putative disease resistance protein At1g50180 isoform X2 [Ipomoea triloba]